MKNSIFILLLLVPALLLLYCKGEQGPPGVDGKDGVSIMYLGELSSPPENPQLNWIYRNSNNKCVYIYNGTEWVLLVNDGSDGVDGTNGIDGKNGLSLFITYNDNPLTNIPPLPTGDGTQPEGWHTNSTTSVVWISQKIAIDASSGTWGTPIPIRGVDGRDASFIYFDGFKDSLKCGTCHTPDIDTIYDVASRIYQWELSKHASGENVDRNTISCAGCHTTEGYLKRVPGTTAPPGDILHSSPISCFVCHSPHKNGDFRLRNTSPVSLISNITGVASVTCDNEESNQCVQCHQPRPMVPFAPEYTKTSQSDSLVITTARWYPHYGVQAQLMMGKAGYEFAGYTYASSVHTTLFANNQISCSDCHMQTAYGVGKAGGHTMKMSYDLTGTTYFVTVVCRNCHSDMYSTSLPQTSFNDFRKGTGYSRSEIQIKLDSLKILLVNKGWIDGSTGNVKASSSKPLIIKPSYKAGILYNFFFIQNDMSLGSHNPQYTKSLLDASLAEMKK